LIPTVQARDAAVKAWIEPGVVAASEAEKEKAPA